MMFDSLTPTWDYMFVFVNCKRYDAGTICNAFQRTNKLFLYLYFKTWPNA